MQKIPLLAPLRERKAGDTGHSVLKSMINSPDGL
jgi:hypothetical protein